MAVITKKEATERLEARGVFVPREWKADKVREVLAALEDVDAVDDVVTADEPAATRAGSSTPRYSHYADERATNPFASA